MSGPYYRGGKRGKPVVCDYVLRYNGHKLAAIEAKKESLSYTEGVRQAKDYAQRLQCRFGYATNGHDIYQMDMLTGEEKLVPRLLTPDELWQLTFDPSHKPGALPEPDFAAVWRERFARSPLNARRLATPLLSGKRH
ncbi:type I restriction enzyme HsdR N-terminal domain-containing protein [Halopseudomonas pachastrellae]|nr:type I restriction enzyme HsdR N-terminal domain-containing protein [Halopseudomonas pachastrellae]